MKKNKSLPAVLTASFSFILCFSPLSAYAENEKTGYWQFVETWDEYSSSLTIEHYQETEVLSGSASSGFYDTNTVTAGDYRYSYTSLEDRLHKGSCAGETGQAVFTFSALPSTLEAGKEFDIHADVSCSTSPHHVGVRGQVMIDYCSSPDSNNYTYFRNKNDKATVIAPAQVWQAEGKSSGGHNDTIGDYSGTFSAVIPGGRAGEDLYIRFHFNCSSARITTLYHYRWVDTTAARPGETPAPTHGGTDEGNETYQPTEPPAQEGLIQHIIQTITHHADTDSGEDQGSLIIPAIVIGLGGALVAAGFLGGSSGKNGDGGEENRKQKTYKMKVYKNFGNGIHKGADPVSVWARIVEVIDGEEINRPELSERITVSGNGMQVRDAGMHNSYRGAEVRVPADCEEEKVTLTFTYEGEGGIFRNNIIFNVLLDPEIMFPTLSQDGREWIMHSEPLNLVAGSGGSARKLFVFDHVSEEPKSIVLNAEGFEVTYEKLDRYPYAYHAVIHNRTAPFEKEAGIFGQQQTVYVNIKAEFPDGSTTENGFSFGLWPEGITVLYSRGQANDLIVHRPGMPAKLQNGRIDVRSFLQPEDKDGRIPDTSFDICCAVPQEDGTAKLVTDSRSYELADLQADDEIAKNVLAKYKCVIGTVDGEEYRSAVLAPQLMNPELVDSYDVWLPVRVQTEGTTVSADIPVRLVGQEPGPSAEWKEEYRLLIRAVNSYYPEEKKTSKLREIEENFNSPTKCDVAELRMLRRTLILWSMVYWQQQKDLAEKEEWDYWSKVWLLSEWGSRKLKWAGDIAFTLLISYKLGSNYEAWLSPLKDFITENLGEAIAESWGDNAEVVGSERAEKFMKKFEDKLYSAFENLLTNQINTDRMDMKLSMSHAASRKLFLKTGLILAGFLIIDFAKNYREMSVEERDCWKAFAKAFSNLSQTAVKQIFASYVAKWMNSKTMQEFFRSKFMKAVNDKVKGVTKGSYTAYNKNYQKLTVRYRGQKVSLSGQATGNVDAGRLDARTFRVHLDDGRTVAIPNVRPDKGNDYLGYIEVISALLSDFFGRALELEIERDLKKAEAAGVIFFQLPMATELSGATLYARVDLKALCENPAGKAFTLVYDAIFACLKLDNEQLFSLVNLPYAEAMRIITTSKTLWQRLTDPNWPEQINWSIFDESEGYTK